MGVMSLRDGWLVATAWRLAVVRDSYLRMPLRGGNAPAALQSEVAHLALGQRGVSPRPSAHPGAPEITTINIWLMFCRATGSPQSHIHVP